MGSGSTLHLFFGDHVHAFDATQKDAGTAKILEPQHRPRAALDRPMVLLDEIVEILGLADPDGRFAISIDGIERSEIGTAFVDRHYLGNAVMSDRFLKETPCCNLVPLSAQQKIDGFTVLVDGAVEIPPFTFDPDVGLAHSPALPDGPLVPAKRLLQYR